MIELVLIAIAGFFCGFFNTLASSGAAVTLPLLIFWGMPLDIANGTNRLPIFVASCAAIVMFTREGAIHWPIAIKVVIPSLLGSLVGSIFAQTTSHRWLAIHITVSLLVSLILLCTKMKDSLEIAIEEPPNIRLKELAILFMIGFWLGFIVLDGATFLMLTLILIIKLPFVHATAIKSLVLASTSAVSIVLFAAHDNIDWGMGFILILGSIVGGVVGAKAVMAPMAKLWAYRLIMLVIFLELLRLGARYFRDYESIVW